MENYYEEMVLEQKPKLEPTAIQNKVEQLSKIFYHKLNISTITKIEELLIQRRNFERNYDKDFGKAFNAIKQVFTQGVIDLVEIVLVLLTINHYEVLLGKNINTKMLWRLVNILGEKKEIISGFIPYHKTESAIKNLIKTLNAIKTNDVPLELKFEIWKIEFFMKNYENNFLQIVDTQETEKAMHVYNDIVFQKMKKKFIHETIQ